jgi:hypothetical protein
MLLPLNTSPRSYEHILHLVHSGVRHHSWPEPATIALRATYVALSRRASPLSPAP